jgi:hypothetical protein
VKRLINEVTEVVNPIKMWSIVNTLLIISGFFLLLLDKMYSGMIIAGVVDQLCVLIFYATLKSKKMQGLYDIFETTGKHILFMSIYTGIVIAFVNALLDTDNKFALYGLIALVIGYIVIRLISLFTIFIYVYEDATYNLLKFFKKEPEIKYITNMDIQVPYYGVLCGEYELIHTEMRYKGQDYKTYPILTYLLEHNKKFEDLTDVEFESFKKIKHFE